jgi:hypothetical protein
MAMRIILALMFFLSFLSHSESISNLSGTWVGHQKNGSEFFHQVLELDKNGKGFYAFSIGDSYLKGWIFPVNIQENEFKDGYITLTLKSLDPKNQENYTVIISPSEMYNELSVLTIDTLDDGSPFFSIGWSLVKTDIKLGTFGLYSFAKSAL